MATINQLRDRIKVRLARRAFTNFDALIVDELVHSQQEILEKDAFLPNFLKHQVDFTIVGAHGLVNLTTQAEFTGFIRPLSKEDVASFSYYDSAAQQYVKIPRFDSRDQLEQLYPGTGTVPLGYFWNGDPLWFYVLHPSPTGDVTYRARFYRADPTTPAAGATTLWSRHAGDLLMHTAGLEVATFHRDKEALAYFAPKRQEAYTRMLRQATAQDMADTDMVMGDD